MDFGAYLASSSSDESDAEGEELSGRSQDSAANEIQRYKVAKMFGLSIALVLVVVMVDYLLAELA